MVKTVLLTGLGLITMLVCAILYGHRRWQSAAKAMRAGLDAQRIPAGAKVFHADDLIGLPAPVERYFRKALTDGQPIVSAVSVTHAGMFNMSETGEQWKPFSSTQKIIIRRPGFDWEGRIRMMPGLTVRVHDAYIAGEGILHASLFGLVSLAHLRGVPEIAQGELMRFIAEAAWYPTVLLPGQGVHWEAGDDTSAKATLKDGNTTVTLLFCFNQDGLIESARAESRGRTVAGKVIPTPWQGRWGRYERRDGMLIPLEGEVAWMLPEGPKPYWRGRITSIRYEFAK